jgi:CDP-diacylglycerol--glycerol-3-phosphate 3-phosphatidyltransferase
MKLLRHVPLALVSLRFILALVVLVAAVRAPLPWIFGTCLVGALLSDYFDGVIARRLGVATPTLRRFDSLVDTVFYVCALAAVLIVAPELLRPVSIPLAALIALEVVRYMVDFRKFGKEASYHMWSSKAWGLWLFVGMYAVLVHRRGGWPVALAVYWGIACDLEGLAISLMLGEWRTDVPSLLHAWRIRKAGHKKSPRPLLAAGSASGRSAPGG